MATWQHPIARPLSAWAATLILANAALAGDWPHWRGPQRSGIVAEESGWKDGAWLPDTPDWKVKVGSGSTAPLVVAGKVYALGWHNGKDRLVCLDAASGKEVWATSYDCREYGRHKNGDEGIYSGPSATPEYDPTTGYLYTLSIDGHLHCWDTAARGKKVWGLNLYDRFTVGQRPKVGRQALRDYGYTSSPFVYKDQLLVEVGAREGNLVAFDKKTGAQRWASANRDPAGHNGGPALIVVEGVPCLAVLTIRNLVVSRLDRGHEGETVATYEWVTDFANSIAGPAVHEDCVLVTSGYNRQSICKLQISLKGASKVWEKPHYSKVCTPVIADGHVYWAWQSLKCLDWKTGELKWQGGQFSDPGSCIVTKDGRVVVWGSRGKLALVEGAGRSPKQYTQLALKDRLATTHAWPHVVLAGGRLLCKDRDGNVICFRLP